MLKDFFKTLRKEEITIVLCFLAIIVYLVFVSFLTFSDLEQIEQPQDLGSICNSEDISKLGEKELLQCIYKELKDQRVKILCHTPE